MLYGAAAEAHINKDVDKLGLDDEPSDYDPDTGIGSHKGVNLEVAHKHAPHRAKYILLGKAKRIDIHPWAEALLPQASVVYFVMEGTPKTDAVFSAGGVSFGIPSVTMWDRSEVIEFAKRLQGKTVLLVPDADWHRNRQVERQALKLRTLLRKCGLDAYVAAPPYETVTKWKGVDDFLGAGHTLGELVIEGGEPPDQRIRRAVAHVEPYQRRSSAYYTLYALSLFADESGTLTYSFPAWMRLLDTTHPSRVLRKLESIQHTFTVTKGSLTTHKEPSGKWEITMWDNEPTISLDEYYAANIRRMKLSATDYFQNAAYDALERRVAALEELQRLKEAA